MRPRPVVGLHIPLSPAVPPFWSSASRFRCGANAVPGTHLCNCSDAIFALLCKYVPGTQTNRLVEKYHQALADEELMRLDDEIALIDALLQDQLERLRQDGEEPIAWGQVMGLVEQRRKLVDTERKRLIDEDRAIPIERLMILMAAIVDIVRRHVASREARRAISDEIRGLIGNGVET